ncbi:Actin-binding FH2 [Artemisia annua]|uniref:Actin-binding FH2 n=1 Tax=Artemisia annua TaxID=35608 RepID=A0A2U1NK22_ARTAN|nr:Actin-binding FH2 [Artemisia annua]
MSLRSLGFNQRYGNCMSSSCNDEMSNEWKMGHHQHVKEKHHQHGRWQARIGRVARNKDLYLGTFKELAKWSPNDTKPTMVKNSSETLLVITNGACDEFPEMVWTGSQDQQQGAYNILNDSRALQDTSPRETALTLHDFDRGSNENGGDCADLRMITLNEKKSCNVNRDKYEDTMADE